MRFILVFLFCLLSLPIFSETIDNIEYHLPAQIAQEWEVSNKLEYPKGTTIIYTQKGIDRQCAQEFFGASFSYLPSNINNTDSIKVGLQKIFPDMCVDLCVLAQTENSVLYEWWATENGMEKMHGWGRMFSSQEGTVVLGYQTENVSNLPDARSLWLPVLKEAHIKQ